ncbi:MAG: PSD1 and planctomycete cytochrome C domain-containing protein [Planctomycetota bacterium]
MDRIVAISLVAAGILTPELARAQDAAPLEFFERRIRPVLVNHCYECHSTASKKKKGGLLLDTRDGLLKGGTSGPALVVGEPEKSLLIRAVRRIDKDLQMPPRQKLTAMQIDDLVAWVKMGAPDPRQGTTVKAPMPLEEDRKFWSFQPVKEPSLPKVKDAAWPRTGVDYFILASLEAAGIRPVGDAEKRTLLRRVTFDLTGLPPTPAEMEAFLADKSPRAFERVVDRLLESPRYGERWGRHWLDLARYADTSGNAADFPVPQAHRYRDWVIRAIQRDLPYDQFLREQIAGDLMVSKNAAEKNERIVATGYLAVCRRFGNGRDGGDGEVFHLMYEDTIDNIGRTILGHSLSCARCHDHKFDPFSMKDYYGLYGIFSSTRFPYPGGEVGTKQDQFVPLVSDELEIQLKGHREKLAAIDAEIKKLEAAEAEAKKGVDAKQLQQPAEQDQQDALQQLTAGGRPLIPTAFRSEAGATAKIADDGSIFVNGKLAKDKYIIDALIPDSVRVRYLRLEALPDAALPAKGAGRARDGNFVVSRLSASFIPAGQTEATAVKFVAARADFEQTGFSAQNALNDGGWAVSPQCSKPHVAVFEVAPELAVPAGSKLVVTIEHRHSDEHALGKLRLSVAEKLTITPPPDSPERARALAAAAAIKAVAEAKIRRTALQTQAPKVPDAYAVSDGKGANVKIHLRGEPEKLGDEAPRRLPAVLGGQELPPDYSASGRLELAEWLTDPKNPLTPRVMVNRIWQHHFGKGIVATPNDFGRRGQAPTHPELLDYLAARFIESGWSIKAMHKQILLSRAWQMASADVEVSAKVDPTNALLWRFIPRRLDAESIRDTLLFVSGLLDEQPGGEHPFPPSKSWAFTQHEPFAADYPTKRRSVYLMQQRSRKDVFLSQFDGADPNASTAVRLPTTTPIQALFFLNAPLAHDASAAFAKRVLAETQDESGRIHLAYLLALNRAPDAEEQQECREFLTKYRTRLTALKTPANQVEVLSWSAFSRALWSGNEFVYVD